VAVPADRDAQPVRRFGTFTPDLLELAAWLTRCGIDTLAMESTSVYWIPPSEGLFQSFRHKLDRFKTHSSFVPNPEGPPSLRRIGSTTAISN
jgi:hypothetical protein